MQEKKMHVGIGIDSVRGQTAPSSISSSSFSRVPIIEIMGDLI